MTAADRWYVLDRAQNNVLIGRQPTFDHLLNHGAYLAIPLRNYFNRPVGRDAFHWEVRRWLEARGCRLYRISGNYNGSIVQPPAALTLINSVASPAREM